MSHWTDDLFIKNAQLYIDELLTVDEYGDQEIEQILNLIRQKKIHPESALDVGCGIGRHSQALGQHGIETVGIDISPTFLEKARKRINDDSVGDLVNFHELDMRALDTMDQTFDIVINLFNTIGYFDDEENIKVLQKMRNRLTEDGVCVIQIENKDSVLANLPESIVQEQNNQMIVEQYEFNSHSSRLTRIRDVFREESTEWNHMGRTEYDTRLYSPPEFEQALKKSGFNNINIYGSYDQSEVEFEKERIVAVAN